MKNFRIATKLILINLIVIFIPLILLVSTLASYYAKNDQYDRQVANEYIFQGLVSSVDSVISAVNNLSISVISNETIRSFIMSENLNQKEYLSLYTGTMETLRALQYRVQAINSITIMTRDGIVIRTDFGGRIFTESEINVMEEKNGKWVWSLEGGSPTFCRMIRNVYDVKEHIAYLKIAIRSDALIVNRFASTVVPENIRYVIIDENGVVLHHILTPQTLGLLEGITEKLPELIDGKQASLPLSHNGSDYLAFPYKLRDGRTYLIGLSADHSKEYRQVLIAAVILVCVLFTLLCILQTISCHHVVIKPITELGKLMNSVETADFSIRYETKSNDEIQVLATKFNMMTEGLENLYNEVYLNSIKLKEAEIANLQSEINPHFLYNTLDSICWMIELERTDQAVQMVRMLSSLFRISLYQPVDGLVPLEKEMEHVSCYVGLQQLRFENKFSFSVEIEDTLIGCSVIKLILQPIVENAIYHGIMNKNDNGEILLNIYMEDNDLIYYCYDNGVGADPEHINEILVSEVRGTKSGLALQNIQERIQLKYGKNYGIQYHRPSGGGSVFLIRQPLFRQGRGEANV